MTENNGWVKLYRSMAKWGWYDDPNTKTVFLHLLLTANWEESEYHGHKIQAGQVVFGTQALAKRLNLSRQQVRTALAHLLETKEITIKTTNKFSVATIENWAKYQGEDDEVANTPTIEQPTKSEVFGENAEKSTNGITTKQLAEAFRNQGVAGLQIAELTNRATTEQPTSNQQVTTSKEIKNIRNKEYIYMCVDKWNEICVDFPKVLKVTPGSARYKTINARIEEYGFDKVAEVFEKTQASPFLKGENGNNWSATFDWVMKPSNFIKVLEGNYDRKDKRDSKGSTTRDWDGVLFG